jgi:hypothetical protein
MVDASHGNSGKDHRCQPHVVKSLASQIEAGESGIFGVMLESFLVAGRQEIGDKKSLTYGQSVTDSCMDFETTVEVLECIASAASRRRDRFLTGPRLDLTAPLYHRNSRSLAFTSVLPRNIVLPGKVDY